MCRYFLKKITRREQRNSTIYKKPMSEVLMSEVKMSEVKNANTTKLNIISIADFAFS